MLSDREAWDQWLVDSDMDAAVMDSDLAFAIFSAGYSAGADAENERLRGELAGLFQSERFACVEGTRLYGIFNPVPVDESEESNNDE